MRTIKKAWFGLFEQVKQGLLMPKIRFANAAGVCEKGRISRNIAEKNSRFHFCLRKTMTTKQFEELNGTILCGICKFKNETSRTIIYANDIFYSIYGYSSRREAISDGFVSYMSVIPEAGRKDFETNLAQFIAGGSKYAHFTTCRKKMDGSLIWVLENAAYSQQDKCINLSVFDVTEQRELEEALSIREKDYNAAASLSMAQFFIYDIKEKTLAPAMNSPVSRFGSSIYGDIPESMIKVGSVPPEFVENYRRFYDEIASGSPSGESYIQMINRLSGERLWYHGKYQTVFDNDGKPLHAVISSTNVTEEREKELASIMYRHSIQKLPRDKVYYFEFNLDKDVCEYCYGKMDDNPEFYSKGWDSTIKYFLSNIVHPEFQEMFRSLFIRENVIAGYKIGKMPASFEFISCSSKRKALWCSIEVDVQYESFSNSLCASCLIKDLDRERSEMLQKEKYIQQLKRELESSRLKIAMNQMQPHFLYNALSSIRTIIKVDPDYAYDLVYDFATHLRGCIKAMSSDEPITFCSELSNIRAYLNIEQMRFGEKLKVIFDIECDEFKILPLSIQPIVENAVRHGIFERGKQGGTVTIRSRRTPVAYVVEVIDDGVGFDLNAVLCSGRDCVGIKNTLFRFENLMHAKVTFDSTINVGTRVEFIIPEDEA